jgi:hypothetical protein
VRRIGAISSTAILLLGFAQAPFFHEHTEDLDHDSAGLAHLHLRHLIEPEEGVHMEARTADDDAIDLAWSVSSPPDNSFVFQAEPAAEAVVIAPSGTHMRQVCDRLHSHDPPALRSQSPRAPPA